MARYRKKRGGGGIMKYKYQIYGVLGFVIVAAYSVGGIGGKSVRAETAFVNTFLGYFGVKLIKVEAV
jgi:hypothetical protein